MRIISWNVNGLRAAQQKGAIDDCLNKYRPDVFLIQETKAKEEQLKGLFDGWSYHQYYHSAKKPGYSGTAVWSLQPGKVINKLNAYDDDEGRSIFFFLDDLVIINLYVPNGGKSQDAWEDKLVFYDKVLKELKSLHAQGKKVILAGDINCAHEEVDLANPKANDGQVGFHPLERQALSNWEKNGFLDVWRHLNPDKIKYSWWSVRTRARERNVGWRIDYFFIEQSLIPEVKKVEYLNEQMGSDHCPILLEI